MSPKISLLLLLGATLSGLAVADTLLVDTGTVDGRMAMASRPDSAGKIEIEAADDFILNSQSLVNSGTFTGLLPSGYNVTASLSKSTESSRPIQTIRRREMCSLASIHPLMWPSIAGLLEPI